MNWGSVSDESSDGLGPRPYAGAAPPFPLTQPTKSRNEVAWPGEKPLAEGFIKRDSHGGGVRVCAVCGITGTGVGGRVVRGSGGVPRTKRTDGGVRGRRQGVREPTCKKGGVAGSIRGKRVHRWRC